MTFADQLNLIAYEFANRDPNGDKLVQALAAFIAYQPQIGSAYQCPRCHVEHGRQAELAFTKKGSDGEDYYHCRACEMEISDEP